MVPTVLQRYVVTPYDSGAPAGARRFADTVRLPHRASARRRSAQFDVAAASVRSGAIERGRDRCRSRPTLLDFTATGAGASYAVAPAPPIEMTPGRWSV